MDNKDFIRGGTALSEKDITSGKIFTEDDALDCRYAWDTGMAIGRYLEELKNGKLLAKVCNSCDRIMIPPRMFCELCFKPSGPWTYVQDTGVINTFSISYIYYDASRVKVEEGEVPPMPAVIEIDGASKGMGILHVLGEIKPEDVKIGMKVKAVWKPESERTGSINDIKYFKPY